MYYHQILFNKQIIEKWSQFSISDTLLKMALKNEKNPKLQEIALKYLLRWWSFHHPEKNETPCQMEKERKSLIQELPRLMNSHSSSVKE